MYVTDLHMTFHLKGLNSHSDRHIADHSKCCLHYHRRILVLILILILILKLKFIYQTKKSSSQGCGSSV